MIDFNFSWKPENLLAVVDRINNVDSNAECYREITDIHTLASFCENENTVWLLSRRELIRILDLLRTEDFISFDLLSNVFLQRKSLMLSEKLYLYWQEYYDNAVVLKLCRNYVHSMDSDSERWVLSWKSWLNASNPITSAAQTLGKGSEHHSYDELLKNFNIKKGLKFEKALRGAFFCYCSSSSFCIDDASLLLYAKNLSFAESKALLKNMLRCFPVILKSGALSSEWELLERYPETAVYLVTSAERSEDAVVQLIQYYLCIQEINQDLHRKYWSDFLRKRKTKTWKEYHYQLLKEHSLLIIKHDQRVIFDYYEQNKLFILRREFMEQIETPSFSVLQAFDIKKEKGIIKVISGHEWSKEISMIQV